MRNLIGLFILLAGCASQDYYRPGPPVTVAEPSYSGQVIEPSPSYAAPSTRPAPIPMTEPPCEPMAPPPRSTFMDWLRSGRGWTWGRASREPIRDEGLDRLMVDTLSNNRPQVSREPLPPVQCLPGEGGSWIFPAEPSQQP
jgi:hypothetical protein